MSTYWGYCCIDCGQETDFYFNHGEEKLIEFLDAKKIMKATKWTWVSLSLLGADAYVDEIHEFLDTHDGHRIALKNEYGEIKPIPKLQT